VSTCKSPVVVAMDFDNASDALALAKRLSPSGCRLKVGKELFTAAGPQLVRDFHALGFEVFLDLKFHDIPNTVAKAVKAAAQLGVWMVNVHASGGARMLTAAREAIDACDHKPLLIAVTVLTSATEEELVDIGLEGVTPQQQVERLAKLVKRCGLDGVVSSAKEAGSIKALCSDSFVTVTPGIRPAGSERGDQRRVMTPSEAVSSGSDYLVIGRPITQADDPLVALNAINSDLGIS